MCKVQIFRNNSTFSNVTTAYTQAQIVKIIVERNKVNVKMLKLIAFTL